LDPTKDDVVSKNFDLALTSGIEINLQNEFEITTLDLEVNGFSLSDISLKSSHAIFSRNIWQYISLLPMNEIANLLHIL